MVSSVKLERSHFFARHDSESKEHSFESSQRDNHSKVNRLLGKRWQSPKAQIPGGEAATIFANALSVKLRGSHAPLRRTTRSTTS